MSAIVDAVAFLTRLPVPAVATARDVQRATRWFPLVGTGIGASTAFVAWALTLTPASDLLVAVITIGFLVALTGAVHLDGAADTADGFGGGRSRDDALRIMRDPRVGTFGALTLVLIVMLKVAALAALVDRRRQTAALVAAPGLARWSVVALGAWLPYARTDDGLGMAAAHRNLPGLAIASVSALCIAVVAAGASAVWLVAVTLAITTVVTRAARRKIGGVTGDVFGACIELTETAVLVTASLLPEASC